MVTFKWQRFSYGKNYYFLKGTVFIWHVDWLLLLWSVDVEMLVVVVVLDVDVVVVDVTFIAL